MAISESQFQLNLLKEFLKLGGPITRLIQTSDDVRRPLIQGSIVQGYEREYIGPLTIQLSGILLDNINSVYAQDCFQYSCINDSNGQNIRVFPVYEEAVLETSVSGVSDVCFASWQKDPNNAGAGRNTGFVDQDIFNDLTNPQCEPNEFGKVIYRVRASSDATNSVYLADIGYLNLIGSDFVTVEANVPFALTGRRNIIQATSLIDVPEGIKTVIIKRVTSTKIEIIGVIYGELSQNFYFPHNTLKPGRLLNKEDQSINLENLALNLILLQGITKTEALPNQFIFRGRNFSDPLIESTVISSTDILPLLINNADTTLPQAGSIPANIATYLISQNRYNFLADEDYAQESISCFDDECFEPDCFTEFINDSLIDRSIENRAIAWTVIYLSGYIVNYGDRTRIVNVRALLQYLIGQINDAGLYYYGWDDTDTDGPYSSLTRNEELRCSTQCAIFMAFLKGFEVTQDFTYIELACNLYNSIIKYFLNNDNLFNYSVTDKRVSVESAGYQLMLSLILEDYEYIEQIVNFFQVNIKPLPGEVASNIVVGTDNVIVTSGDNVVLSPTITLVDDAAYSLFQLTDADTYLSREEIFKYNYLIYSSLLKVAELIPVSNLDYITEKYEFVSQSLVESRTDASLTFVIGDLLDNISFLNFDTLAYQTVPELHNYKFSKEILFQRLIDNIPTDYEWFKPEVLNRNSNLGKMMYTVANLAARDTTWNSYLDRIGYIDGMYGILLDRKADDVGITRFRKESDDELRRRIKLRLLPKVSTEEAFLEALDNLDSAPTIKDNTAILASVEDLEQDIFVDTWGAGYLQGVDIASTGVATLTFNQPIESDVYNDVFNHKPAGVGLRLIETIAFPISSSGNEISIRITDIIEGCEHLVLEDNDEIPDNEDAFTQEDGNLFCLETPNTTDISCNNIDLQTSDDLLTEDDDRICLEDDETIMPDTITGYVPDPGPPPPAPDQLTCECEGLRGYITVDTIATELRNMRTVEDPPGEFFWDVNATNETVEPCDLLIESALTNTALQYLEINSLTLPTDVATARRIDYIFDDAATVAYYVWSNTSTPFISKLDPTQPLDPAVTITLPLILQTQKFTAINLIEHIVIVSDDQLYTVNKANMTINTSFTIDANITELSLYADTGVSARIYSRQSSDDTIYHYSYDDGNDSITALSSVLMTDTRTHNYVESTAGLVRYSASATDIEVWGTPNFDELGTVTNTLAPLDTGDDLTHILSSDNFVYIGSSVPGPVFSDVDVYTNNQTLLKYKLNTSSTYELQYLDLNNVDFFNTGQPYVLRDYVLMKGTNNVYGLNNNTLQSINNFVCSSDPTTIPAGVTIMSIDPVRTNPNAVLVSAVDLLTPQWYVFTIEVKNKVCS